MLEEPPRVTGNTGRNSIQMKRKQKPKKRLKENPSMAKNGRQKGEGKELMHSRLLTTKHRTRWGVTSVMTAPKRKKKKKTFEKQQWEGTE